jgi:dihydropteroate synthase
MTRAQKLIRESSTESQKVDLMHEVFDTAWRHIAPALQAQPQEVVDGARNLLATTIIDRVKIGLTQPGILQDEAIGVVKGSYPQLPISGTYLY